ncbi:MAG: gamma carbonic anhydrase family protein [Pseudomonadota bacterium]
MPLYALDERVVVPDNAAYWVAPTATVLGHVRLGDEASVWFNAVVRGDNELIDIGPRVNIQDGCVLHTDPGYPMTISEDCTVGHMVMLHGCQIGPRSLIGIGSIVLNGAQIGEECLIGANTLIPEGKIIPARSMVLGSPGRVVRELTDEEVSNVAATAGRYVANWKRFAAKLVEQPEPSARTMTV